MQIVWDRTAVEKLKKTHTVLELETFDIKGFMTTVYCVVPVEKIGLNGFSSLESYKELHTAFIQAYNEKNYKLCEDLSTQLIGAFGGEVDSFYEEILNRIKKTAT
jgi:hypothetical protein